MSISLQKGQKVSLTKDNQGLSKVIVGLGWDEVKRKKGLFAPKPQSIDCDASVILCGENGKLVSSNINDCCVYFGNLCHASGAIVHQGDNLTGAGDGDDEQVMVDLSRIPANVHKLVFVVNIYDGRAKNQHFGMIKNAFIRLVDARNNMELCRYNLTEDYSGMTAMVFGEVYRHNGEWKFNAIGQGTNDNSVGELANRYIAH